MNPKNEIHAYSHKAKCWLLAGRPALGKGWQETDDQYVQAIRLTCFLRQWDSHHHPRTDQSESGYAVLHSAKNDKALLWAIQSSFKIPFMVCQINQNGDYHSLSYPECFATFKKAVEYISTIKKARNLVLFKYNNPIGIINTSVFKDAPVQGIIWYEGWDEDKFIVSGVVPFNGTKDELNKKLLSLSGDMIYTSFCPYTPRVTT